MLKAWYIKKILKEYFKPKKGRWYIVNLQNYHQPVLIRKHFFDRTQALSFINRYLNIRRYEVVQYKDTITYNLSTPKTRANKRYKVRRTWKKWDYPEDCITEVQKLNFRQNERKKFRRMKRLPKLSKARIWEILDDKPMLFLKRLKTVRRNHWVMSQPIPGSYSFLARYRWPNKIVHLCNIARVLHRYYDLGDYRPEWVTYAIFKIWEKRIMKRCGGYMANPTNPEKVAKEFRARGFVEKSEVNFEPEVDSWVESIRLTPTLVHPELCWHKFDDRFIYDNNIYEFQRNMGIPGWSKAHVAGLDKRK